MTSPAQELLRTLDPDATVSAARERLDALAPGFADLTTEVAYGIVRQRPGIDQRGRELATVCALIALGRERQLAVHLGYALNLGVSRRELAEIAVQLALYAGWPAAVNALTALGDVLDQRAVATATVGPHLRVSVLSDGTAPLPLSTFAANLTDDERADAEEELGPLSDTAPIPLHPVVLEFGDRLVVVDPGLGGGAFRDRLRRSGFAESDVDLVVLTHLHADHAEVLASGAFADAEVAVSETEVAYWRTADTPVLGDTARAVLAAIEERMRPLDGIEGITPIAAPGHTPGHVALALDGLLLLGDTACHPLLSLRYPDAVCAADVDGAAAVATRRTLLDRAARSRDLVHGYHLPGLGRIEAEGDAFRWLAI